MKNKISSLNEYAQMAVYRDHSSIDSVGDYCQLASAGYGSIVISAGDHCQLAAAGDSAKISSSGDYNTLVSAGARTKLASNGDQCIIAGLGVRNFARGKVGSWLVLADREDEYPYVIFDIKAVQVDGKNIKADTYYRLRNGKFLEIEE